MKNRDEIKDATITQRQHEAAMERGSTALLESVLRHFAQREERLFNLTQRQDRAA